MCQDEFQIFTSLWSSYKRSCSLTKIEDIGDQLKACCDSGLLMDRHSSLRSSVNTASEVVKMREMERLAVISHSNMVNIVGLLTAHQEGQVLPCKNQEVGRCL